jgi:hypothetical protein
VSSFADTLRIRSLRKQIEASRTHCDELALEFEAAQTKEEKSKIAREYDKALKKTHAMQFLLELQERKQQDATSEQPRRSDRAQAGE